MKQRIVSAQTGVVHDRHAARVGGLAVLVSLSSFFYYFQRGDILMHGDATAHINIARRVFDSLTPGPLALGTVWLPLPHVLMMPFLVPDKMWQSGVGGSIPSMIAYVLGVLGVFRLVGGLLESDARTRVGSRIGAWIAAFAYGANPNLIYMQTTALTETLALCFFIWSIVYLVEFLRDLNETTARGSADPSLWRSLRSCALCVACAEMTRYDGWFLAGMTGSIVLVIALRRWNDRSFRRMAVKFLLGIALAPVLWLAYNAAVYGNPLEFAMGAYSSKAIELRVGAPNAAFHNPLVAGEEFLKAGQAILAVGNWGRFWLAGALLASLLTLFVLRKKAIVVLLLLWAPVAFYSYSIAFGWVPLHVPMWWPFAVFNIRFGLELLPMFAVTAGLLVAITTSALGKRREWMFAGAMVALTVTSYAFVLKADPLCWVEAARNWDMRRAMDTSVGRVLSELPPNSIILMDLSEHVGALERIGFPLRRVVNSENHRVWKRPNDPDGLWEKSLADPGRYVQYVITFDGDAVDEKVNKANLKLLTVLHAMGRPPARVYAAVNPATTGATGNNPANQSR